MGQIIFKIWYMIAILPLLIAIEGYHMLKGYLTRKNYWGDVRDNWMYVLLGFLILLFLVLLLMGYR